ncbi:helix-turn-helix domain-containing protein [Actinomadura algeriensis]|uniref:Transcriptional regulator with XRE-family HTH domain n=1 Tax=Actinomadura algeriensis TaxID=1679523 RepID=A0ABR9JV30_9ACTN|nr:helix-turn-helix transcriptional regulator [Actinomadura algeriensis]MBE1534269.1 transcriptional regulator with XRE-family HTH domain [Actinomadura algeriensis]
MAPKRGNNERTAYQEVFVVELRARRNSENLSRNKLAQALGCTPQWLAKVENLEKPPSEGLAADLDTYFACDGMFHRIWVNHAQARRDNLIPTGFRPLAEMEKDAEEISIYEPLLVTGLVQGTVRFPV